MTNLPTTAARSSTSLARIDPEIESVLAQVSTPDEQDGKMLLDSALSLDERRTLTTRLDVLDRWLIPGRPKVVAEAISAMLVGFGGKATTLEEAQVVATQWQRVLQAIPEWAVQRACQLFASGGVRPDELGVKSIDWSFPPSSAQFHKIAQALAEPHLVERHRIKRALTGIPPKPRISQEEGTALMKSALAGYLQRADMLTAAEREARTKRYTSTRKEMADAGREMQRAEYVAAGLDPPEGEIFPSLPFLREMGWTIVQERDGTKKLLRPAAPPPLRRSLGG